ncbi:hypothetical protein [Streptomyces sp. NPDC090026]|uniref:hypothetical protein n=1 Tax=unclassified Streptomyces TaxID=2593676 RepID=UPI00381ADBF5
MTHDEREPTEREEARLRIALGLIGEEAQRQGPVSRAAAPTVWWRRRQLAGPLAAVAVAAAVVLGVVLSGGATNGARDSGGGDAMARGQSDTEAIACARMIVEGDIVGVRESSDQDRVLVTLDVTEWFKPTRGAERVELDLVDPAIVDADRAYQKGQHVLIYVPTRDDLDANPDIDDEVPSGRKNLEHNLPRSKGVECPPYWKNPPS